MKWTKWTNRVLPGWSGTGWSVTAAAVVLACALAMVAPASPVEALERRTTEVVAVSAGETVADDLFASGRSVRIDGRVQGDVIAFAQTIIVNGTIEGDLIAAGAQVILNGTVQGDVRAAGANLQLNGAVGRNVLGASQALQLGSDGRVGGNLTGAGEAFSILGNVDGSVSGTGGDVELQGRVGRNAELALRTLTVGPQASIGGRLIYHAREQVSIPTGVAAGGVDFRPVVEPARQRSEGMHGLERGLNALGNFLSLAWLAGSAIVGIVLLRLFPRFGAEFLGALETQPLPSLGVGVLGLIGTIPVAILICLTIVGIPIGLMLLFGYSIGLFVGWLFLSLATGSILVGLVRRGRPWHPSWAFLLGLLVLYLATRIPFVGGLVTFAGLSFGLGAFLITLYRTWHQSSLPPASSISGGRLSAAPILP
ncbi:MAG TPA: polymer-forming cytoskeletal protein [Chloroflexota bacterium]|nr:polymer-forming cytoskeletal protein [Chloroflexota bacterium]